MTTCKFPPLSRSARAQFSQREIQRHQSSPCSHRGRHEMISVWKARTRPASKEQTQIWWKDQSEPPCVLLRRKIVYDATKLESRTAKGLTKEKVLDHSRDEEAIQGRALVWLWASRTSKQRPSTAVTVQVQAKTCEDLPSNEEKLG